MRIIPPTYLCLQCKDKRLFPLGIHSPHTTRESLNRAIAWMQIGESGRDTHIPRTIPELRADAAAGRLDQGIFTDSAWAEFLASLGTETA
jgi:hypothetical protein